MNFKDAKSVIDVIRAGDEVARIRGENRVRVNNAANGFPPLTESESKAQNLKVNVSLLEQPILHATARRQYTRNFNGTEHFFRVTIPTAPTEKETEWSTFITNHINSVLKESRPYFFLGQNRWTALVGHGIAPQMWWDNENWLPKFVPIEDFRVATDTNTDFENLEWVAIRLATSEGELTEKVFGKHADENWNKKAMSKILHAYRNQNYEDVGYQVNWLEQPEKMAELVKQNLGYYSSDAVPTIALWHFFHKVRKEGRTEWMLQVVPDWNVQGDVSEPDNTFLYTSDEPFAYDLDNFLHVQFGDLSNTTPQKVWSVRALGFELLDLCFWDNITFCRTIQHLHESMNIWLRVVDPSAKARAQKIDLYDKAIIPEGVGIVPQNERHQLNQQLIQYVMAQLKQRIGEASASYTQQSDTGTAKEQTAYETAVKMSMVNAMMEGLLLVASFQEVFSYREICRRFCLRNSSNADAKKFQKGCEQRKIPKMFVNSELWKITAELPMGSGNPAMAISQAQQLLQMRPMFGPQAQQEILHDATSVITGNANKAARWVPLDGQTKATPAQKVAEADFAILIRGLPSNVLEGVSLTEQVETLLGLLAGEIMTVMKTGGGDMRGLLGMQNTSQHITSLIELIAQNPPDKEKANAYRKDIGELDGEIKKLGQMLAQKQAASNGQPDPAAMAKAQAITMQAGLKAQVTADKAAQGRQQKEESFIADQRRKDAALMGDEERKAVQTGSQIGRDQAVVGSQIDRDNVQSGAEIARDQVKTQSDIIQEQAKAKANLESKVKNSGK